jgi:hypothetical protein
MPSLCGTVCAMRAAIKRNFHVPLTDELYASLRREAGRAGRPATDLAREAIEALIRVRRRRALDRAIATYAAAVAGTSADLDRDLEAAALEHVLSGEGR